MTRNGKIARLPAAMRDELNQRLLDGQPGKELVEWLNGLPKVQALLKAEFKRIKQILGIGDGYDGSINPELTRPPAIPPTIQPNSVPANIGQYR
jgi:hypothetical protein